MLRAVEFFKPFPLFHHLMCLYLVFSKARKLQEHEQKWLCRKVILAICPPEVDVQHLTLNHNIPLMENATLSLILDAGH